MDAAALVRAQLRDSRPYHKKTLTVQGDASREREVVRLAAGVAMEGGKEIPCTVRVMFRKLSDVSKAKGPVTVRGRCEGMSRSPNRYEVLLMDAELVQAGKE